MNWLLEALSSAGPYLYLLLIIGVLIAFLIGTVISRYLSRILFSINHIRTNTVGADPTSTIAAFTPPVGKFILIAGFGLLLSLGVTLGLARFITTFAPANEAPVAPTLEMLVTPDTDGSIRTLRFTYQPRAVISSDVSLTVEVTGAGLDATHLVIWYAAGNDMKIRTDEICPKDKQKSEKETYSCAKPRGSTVTLHWYANPEKTGPRFVTLMPDPATPGLDRSRSRTHSRRRSLTGSMI